MAVSLEVLDNLEAPAVGITVEGLSSFESSRIAIYRQTPGRERTLVQGLGDVNVDGAGYWVDYLPPLGVPVTYTVEVLAGTWDGVFYEWTGEPHYSFSERIHLEESWRNEYENPTFAGGVGLETVWENLLPSPRPSYSTARYQTTSATGVASGDNYREIEITSDVTGGTTFYRTQSTNGHTGIAPGEIYTGRVGVGNPNSYPVTLRAGFLRTTVASLALAQTVTPNVTIPAGGYEEIEIGPSEISSTWETVRVGIVAPDGGTLPSGTRLWIYDGVTITRGEECPHLIHGDMPFGERDPDLRGDWYSQRWSSPSRLAAPSVHGVATSGEVKAIRVSDWGAQGSALRVMTGVPDPFGLEFAGAFAEAVRQYDLEEGPDFEIFHHVGALLPQVMVTCFHGGDMEYGALELGDAVASALGSTWWGIDAHVRPEKVPGSSLPSWDSLHLSSNNYGHPGLLAMLAECDVAVSFHGSRDTGEDIHSPGSGEGVPFSFIGGTNETFKEAVAVSLRRHGFLCDTDVENFPSFAGTNPSNLVHQTRSGSGVQIEISNTQRRAFFVGGDLDRPNRGNTTQAFTDYMNAIVAGVQNYLGGM